MHSTPRFEKWAIQKEGIIQTLLPTGGYFFIAGDNTANYKLQPLWAKHFSDYSVYFQFHLKKCPLKWWKDVAIAYTIL